MKILRYTAATLAGIGLAKAIARGSREGNGGPTPRAAGNSEETAQVLAGEVAAKKEVQERPKASEPHFHQLADAMPQIAFTARPDGYVDYFNQKWFDYSGFTETQTYVPDGRSEEHTS